MIIRVDKISPILGRDNSLAPLPKEQFIRLETPLLEVFLEKIVLIKRHLLLFFQIRFFFKVDI